MNETSAGIAVSKRGFSQGHFQGFRDRN